ncbi:PglL family O-oligosaccharyltransferase [Marinobacter subterrani]|uniref:PglL family O-oligosaccharyltransferase n=1 Tax=Marinobacter subterrani TaxID=1658765 RepID=UPI002353AA41|nr:Wzy polymerase domain-containing protein [Marinobacter subterrani]
MTSRSGRFFASGLMVLMLAPAAGLFRSWPLNSALVDGLAILFGGLMSGGVLMLASSHRFTVSPLLGAVVVMALIAGLSVVMNSFSIEASWRWYILCFFLSAFVVLGASDVVHEEGNNLYVSALINALWFGAVVYSVLSLLRYYGILQFGLPWLEPSTGRMGGIWSQPNLTNTTAWLGLLASVTRFDWRVHPCKLASCVFLFGWIIACAASRMSWLYAIGLLLLIGGSWLPVLRSPEIAGSRLGLIISVFTVIVLFFLVPTVNEPLGRWLTENGIVDRNESVALATRNVSEDAARLSELGKLRASIGDFSLSEIVFGIGPGQYAGFSADADLGLPPENLTPAIWLHSHNLFTMVFIELGALGLFLVVGVVFSIAWQVFRKPMGRNVFFIAGALSILFIHSNLEFPLWYPWFLFLTWLLIVPLFKVRSVKSDLQFLKPVVGGVVSLMIVMLLINVGSQYRTIASVALDPEPDQDDYRALVVLANDSLLGPYAVLRRYRDFAAETSNLEWQLREVRQIKAWQPRDLVMLREFSLLTLMKDLDGACNAATLTAYRYPMSAPLMLEHAILAKTLGPTEVIKIAECIEKGLEPRNETIPTMKKKNRQSQKRISLAETPTI